MSKKRNIYHKENKRRSRHKEAPERRGVSLKKTSQDLLAFIFTQKEPVSIHDIMTGISPNTNDKHEIEAEIALLIERGDLVSTAKHHFKVNEKGTIFSGKLEKNPRGFGFLIDLQPRPSSHPFTKDPFLSIGQVGSANHGDTLLVRIMRVRNDGRPEAEVLTILERSKERLTGFFKNGDPPFVIPEDPRMPSHVQLAITGSYAIADGDVVIVQILPNPLKTGSLYGEIVEVLGPPQNIDVQMRMVIEKHNLPHTFSRETLKEANALSVHLDDITTRVDFRDIDHVTIDGETAKDFDDAVAVEKTRKGFRLYVSIADVSFFVKPGTSLDQEAFNRGTSIYFPGRVIPMLPEKLSNNLCSLIPNEDRLTFTAILDFDKTGIRTSARFCKSVIHSKQRFTYTTVKMILIDNDSAARKAHKPFVKQLKWAGDLATILHQKRMRRGSIGFNIPEAEIALEDDGKIQSIRRAERNFAHQIIEEFMLAANEAVAEAFTAKEMEAIYRIHEKPEPEKVKEFASFAQTLGLLLPPAVNDPSWFGKVLDIVKNSPTEYVINNILLRTMQQARYDSDNQGHFGLAATDYTHFTSPIRRYPDLIVHRLLDTIVSATRAPKKAKGLSLKEQAEILSARERAAISAEREMNDRLKVFFMEKFIGEDFNAIISGVNESAIFIELLDLFISGSIDISRLRDDYYLYDAKRYRLIGQNGGKIYQLGNAVKVTLVDIDHQKKRISFIPWTPETAT